MMSWKSLAVRRLVLLASLTEAVYVAGLVLPFSLFRHYSTPLLDLGKLTGHGPWLAVVVAMALVFLFYVLAVRTEGGPSLARFGVLLGAAFAVTQAAVYPIGALDIFDYLFAGHEMAAYGANPYLVKPLDFNSDPLFPYVGWQGLSFTYGPLWGVASRLLSALAGDNLLANLLLYKAVAVAAYVLTAVLVYAILQRMEPQRVFSGTMLFAWNPLVLFEAATNGHNDIVLALFLLTGVAAFAVGRKTPAMIGLALSVLTKFVSAPLALVWGMAALRSTSAWGVRLKLIAGAGLAAMAVALLLYVPFLGERSHWREVLLAPVLRGNLFTSSFPAMFVYLTADRLGVERAEKIARNAALLALAVFTIYQALRVKGDWQDMVRASLDVLLFYLLFLCLWFQPWYTLWLVPFVALLPLGRRTVMVLLFCVSSMAKYLVYDFFWFWSPNQLDALHIEAVAVAVIYAAPLLYLIWSVIPRWRRRVDRRPAKGPQDSGSGV